MEFSQYKDKLDEYTNKSRVEWETYLDWWREKNPEPVEPVVNTPKMFLGIKFWLVLSAAIGAFALSAFRVSERFYVVSVTASKGNLWFSMGETISAVFAVNMTIFALAITVAYIKEKTNETGTIIGLGVAITISAIAGFGQAIAGLGLVDWVSLVDLVLAFVMGLGVTALEYLTGDLLGVELVRFKLEKKLAYDEYVSISDDVRSKYVHEHKEWLRTAKAQFGLFMANTKKFIEDQNEQEQQKQSFMNGNTNHRSNSVNKQDIIDLLDVNYKQTGQVLGVSELTRELAFMYLKLDKNNLTQQDVDLVRKFVQSKKGNVSQVRQSYISGLQTP